MITPTEKRLRDLEDGITFLRARVENGEKKTESLSSCPDKIIDLVLMHTQLEQRICDCEDVNKKIYLTCQETQYQIKNEIQNHSELACSLNHYINGLTIGQECHTQILSELQKQLPEISQLATRASHEMRDLSVRILQQKNYLEEHRKILENLQHQCVHLKKEIDNIHIGDVRNTINVILASIPQTTEKILDNQEVLEKFKTLDKTMSELLGFFVQHEIKEALA